MSIQPSEFMLTCDVGDDCESSLRDTDRECLQIKASHEYGWLFLSYKDEEVWACPEHRKDVSNLK